MPKYQAKAIQSLCNEHKTIRYLLDLLAQQIALFERTERPDYELIKEIVDYFLTYPELCHHHLKCAPENSTCLRVSSSQV